MFINFSDLPAHQNIFLDYLYEFEKVEKYFNKNFRDVDEYPVFLSELANYNRPHRDAVINIIKKQYQNLNASKQTEVNLELLASKKTLAVVTGQQLGIFGGPMYTFYKTITAIKLCRSLKEKFEGYNFVPVFWLEGDDHDLDEVSSLNIIDKSNELKVLKYGDALEEGTNKGSVGHIKLTEDIRKFIKEFNDETRDSDFKEDLMNRLNSSYKEGVTFNAAFKNLIFDIFDEYGLIIFNPQEIEIKRILKDIFKNELENFREHTDVLVEKSAELEEEYHAQVKVKPINLFASEKDGRFLIEPVDENYRLKGKRKTLTKDELFEWLERAPEDFSPNVLLRPICQDYLLPTAFYIAGPGEISYFAQVTPLYGFFNIPQPYIYPRGSATIVEKNITNVLEKYNLKYTDLFFDEKELIEKVIGSLSEAKIDDDILEAKNLIEEKIIKIRENFLQIDQTLGDVTDKSLERINQTLDQLMQKAKKAEERNHETAIRQVTKARNLFYPNNNLQERELNFTYIVNKYGIEMLKWILEELAVNKFEHQIIEL
ncbi:MAG: bacillithiol biosynthesis cysteine-adding enzyme BshC [Bacteroidetes bacterium]|nr:bacillithiol biosynthesis cysteine-adding enzyme BshC [Bacteroidota bacterium]